MVAAAHDTECSEGGRGRELSQEVGAQITTGVETH